MTARAAALAELRTRLSQISIVNGYTTDVGEALYIGETPALGPDDPTAACAMVVREDAVNYVGENVRCLIPVDVQAIAKVASADPWGTIEDILGDIKRAVETDHDLAGTLIPKGLTRGSTAPLSREPGSDYVGAQITYFLDRPEQWGNP